MYYRYQEHPSFWEGLVNGFMQQREKNKEAKSLQSIIDLQQPSNVDTGTGMRSQINFDPNLQTVKGAAPQRGLFDFAKIGQTPPIYNGPQEQQPIGLMQPQQVTGQNALTMPQQPAPQIQAPTITQRERTIKDVEGDIRKSYATRMQQAIKSGSIDPTMLRQYMPQIQQQMNSEIEQARGDYTKQQEQTAWANFEKAPDYKSKMMTGIKAGLNPQLLKLALDSGMEVKTIDLGDRTLPLGIGKDGSIVNLITGKQPTAEEMAAGVNPTAKYNKETLSADTKYSIDNRPVPSGGGSGGASRYVMTPLGAMTTDQLLDTYTKAKGGRIKQTDQYGNESYKEVPPNQEILNILGPIIQAASGGGGYQPARTEDPRVAAARAAGYSDAEIQAFLSGSSPQPQTQRPTRQMPTLTDNSNLDVINNNWQF